MGSNWNNMSESEKADMRARASDIGNRASEMREHYESQIKSKKDGDKEPSIFEKICSGIARAIELSMNNISKMK